MDPMTEPEKTALRNDLLNLAVRCPVEHSNPVDCPLFGIRKLSPAKRRQWFDQLPDDDLVYLSAYHPVCAQLRLEFRLTRFCS